MTNQTTDYRIPTTLSMEYVPTQYQEALAARYRTAAIIVIAFCVSVLVHLTVAKFMTVDEVNPGTDTWPQPVYSAVIVLGVVVVALRRILLSKTVMATATQRGASAVLQHLFAMTVIICALAEVAAIGGLVLYKLTGDYQYSWRLGVVSLFLLLYTFPRKAEWARAVAASAKTQTGGASQVAK
ncbi:MAG: hypothetical protein ACRD82_16335 [Blastocatellia bacterium]